MAVSGILGRWNLAGLRVSVEAPEEIYDGRPTLLAVHLENRRRWLPAFLIEVRLPVGRARFVAVARRETGRAALPAVFHGRGVQPLGPARVCSPFPVNFFVRSLPAPLAGQVTVFPDPLPCREAAGAGRRERGGEQPARRKGYEGEISRIGDYRGEPLKLIHWKLSARHGELMVKELSTVARPPVLIDLDRLSGNLEERLRCAAFLVNTLQRGDRPVGLRLGGEVLPPAASRGQRLRLLGALAVYGQGQHAS
jgi:uncharacterized protein (DUF58 family)